MNLKPIAVLFALTLPLAGCGNKGPLLRPVPVAPAEEATMVEPAPAATDTTAPAEETVPADEAVPADADSTTVPEPVPGADDQDG